MKTDLTDLIRLASLSGRIPAEIPDHYVQHVLATHRIACKLPVSHRKPVPLVIHL